MTVLALVIDTSSAAVTAGVIDVAAGGLTVLAERVTVNARGHAELLMPAIRSCLAETRALPGELSAVVAGVGPGPFTGLRVGLVSAAAFADALGVPTYAVGSLDAIAAAVTGLRPLLVAGDARRREVYWAKYPAGADRGTPGVGKAADIAANLTGVQAMVGAGARLYEAVLGLPLLDTDYPTVAGLSALAADRIRLGAPGETLTPMYLRRPDAVEPVLPKRLPGTGILS